MEDGYSKMFVVNFAKKVEEMRDAQKAYFKGNKHYRHLEKARMLEKEVDAMLDDIINPNNQLDLPL